MIIHKQVESHQQADQLPVFGTRETPRKEIVDWNSLPVFSVPLRLREEFFLANRTCRIPATRISNAAMFEEIGWTPIRSCRWH